MVKNQEVIINRSINTIMKVCLILSLINNWGLILFLLFTIIYAGKNSIQAVKSICMITIRSVLNPELAPSISQFENLKWLVLFICSAYLILKYFEINNRKEINNILYPVILYLIYSSISSFISSTLPIVALMKLFSYGAVFIGILIGVYITINKFDWIEWIHKLLVPIVVVSPVLYVLGLGFHHTNSSLFRGPVNHPNILGAIVVLFIALNFTKIQLNLYKNVFIYHLLISISFVIIWWTQARTSFIAAVILLVSHIFLLNINILKKTIVIDFCC